MDCTSYTRADLLGNGNNKAYGELNVQIGSEPRVQKDENTEVRVKSICCNYDLSAPRNKAFLIVSAIAIAAIAVGVCLLSSGALFPVGLIVTITGSFITALSLTLFFTEGEKIKQPKEKSGSASVTSTGVLFGNVFTFNTKEGYYTMDGKKRYFEQTRSK